MKTTITTTIIVLFISLSSSVSLFSTGFVAFFAAFVGLNGVVEAIAGFVIASAVSKALLTANKKLIKINSFYYLLDGNILYKEYANNLYKELSSSFMTSYDESGSIGKRYRRQDAIGTPFCITIDDETVNNGTVTVRDRDTMEQVTLKIEEVKSYIEERVKF